MRVLLDGCGPKRLAGELSAHEVETVQEMGWGDLHNGSLLDAMAGRFDVLVTVDKGLPKQTTAQESAFAVVVLRAKTNRLTDLLPFVPALRLAIEELRPGQVRELAYRAARRRRQEAARR